ncbi:E3 ubiquitin protein ligase RIE1 [Apostasia shenzhenica]|uniref:RING-type E3 ubiquitin transferase n=1 Tax=Apostasia shenzhenica TaxID=1088818 RepID=A0A2H9ZV79_9ASPA|nr:E3 ubiquitin protein ligase RIE1 [Apostasia shenzhenica]
MQAESVGGKGEQDNLLGVMEEEASAMSSSPVPLLRRSPRSSARLANPVTSLLGPRGAPGLVRETAARQLEERRADWAYSRPVVFIDILWNLSFVVVSVFMLAATASERPNVPVRVWIVVYAIQCVLHVALVLSEYRRRREAVALEVGDEERGRPEDFNAVGSEQESDDSGSAWGFQPSSFIKRCESVNTMASCLWWIVGFYWVISGGEVLVQNAPRLYWSTLVFLAIDVCFAILFIALAFAIGVALCCCLPCMIAILYAIGSQEGASDADISLLPRYRFEESSVNAEKNAERGKLIPIMNCSRNFLEEHQIPHEYAECCICLTSYEHGTELYALPCNHHFHSTCISKWLMINATCPLCKYNILKGNDCI